MMAEQGLPFMGIYSATKAASQRITEALYNECKQFNIKVSPIIFGTLKTNFNVEIMPLIFLIFRII
ncbi:MAG: SDR family NAD(P)-dependent oxidoreductase [Candidatus Heimdallarchaeota archaeon]|nr:SDR family NAD(P)-dependent oxidoreductase [Candidatus Heimdallarchaeota archaeon]